jgi:2-C-methyl-D-erythritol 4-phosphate cytidylyltransferase
MSARRLSVAVLIPAAGTGSRLGGLPKQDRLLGDAPLLEQTIRSLCASPIVRHVLVAVDAERVDAYRVRLESAGLPVRPLVVAGGASRQASVAALVQSMPNGVDVALVHDAARPFVSADLVERVAQAAWQTGAASPAVAVADTLRRGGANLFGETVDRDGVFQVQTPQGFRPDVLLRAHAASDPDAPATDDAGLAQQAGHPVALVVGSRSNFKITTPDDWDLALALWPLWSSGTLS